MLECFMYNWNTTWNNKDTLNIILLFPEDRPFKNTKLMSNLFPVLQYELSQECCITKDAFTFSKLEAVSLFLNCILVGPGYSLTPSNKAVYLSCGRLGVMTLVQLVFNFLCKVNQLYCGNTLAGIANIRLVQKELRFLHCWYLPFDIGIHS